MAGSVVPAGESPPGVLESTLLVGGADELGSAAPVGPPERGGAVDPVAGSGR
ncbi:hypothetical protein GTW65_36620, partial [Streptomyces sp. SID4956]|nr:hypothetical protein [Streptomyces sp. SID4956]